MNVQECSGLTLCRLDNYASYIHKVRVSMTRKCHRHTMQTNSPRHRKEEPPITNNHRTSGRQFKKNNQLSLSLSLPQTRIEQQNHHLRTESGLSIGVEGGGLKCILLVQNIRPRFYCFQNNIRLLLLSAVYFFFQVKRPNGLTRKFWLLYDIFICVLGAQRPSLWDGSLHLTQQQ